MGGGISSKNGKKLYAGVPVGKVDSYTQKLRLRKAAGKNKWILVAKNGVRTTRSRFHPDSRKTWVG
jgi:hypothetical protein